MYDDVLTKNIEQYLQDNFTQMLKDIESLVVIPSVEDYSTQKEKEPFGAEVARALNQGLAIATRMGLAACNLDGYIGYADFQGKSDRQIAFIGHVDVVPAGPGWTFEPYAVSEKDNCLVGRGVSDDKGPLVVAMHALKFWIDQGASFNNTVRVIFGANEETKMKDIDWYKKTESDPDFLFTPDSDFPVGYAEAGIAHAHLRSEKIIENEVVELRGGVAPNAVPGEAFALVKGDIEKFASTDKCFVSDGGDGLVRIDAKGQSAHASTPEQGCNAIGLLVDFLNKNNVGNSQEKKFLALLSDLFANSDGSLMGVNAKDEHFGPLTATGSMISMSDQAINQVIDFRYPTTITSREITERMNKWAEPAHAEFSIDVNKDPYLTNPKSEAIDVLTKAYSAVTKEETTLFTSKGGTYARVFSSAVSFGPEFPNCEMPDWAGAMHGPDEAISIEALKEAFRIYVRAIYGLANLKFDAVEKQE